MATPLDLAALEQFRPVFPFLFVLVVTFAILASTDWFKEKKGIAAMLAVILALMTLFSKVAMKTINLMAPWFVLLVIFLLLMMLLFMVLGAEQKAIFEFVKTGEFGIGIWVAVLMIIIGLGSFFSVVNEETGGLEKLGSENGTLSDRVDAEFGFWQTIFHPKVLGLALLLMVAFFTVKYMTTNELT